MDVDRLYIEAYTVDEGADREAVSAACTRAGDADSTSGQPHHHRRRRERQELGAMGQKVHPKGFGSASSSIGTRSGSPRREYADLYTRICGCGRFLKERLYHAGISKIEIERAANKAKINIYTARPGIVIGKKGAEIEKLKSGAGQADEQGDASSTSTRCVARTSMRSWWPRTSRCSSNAGWRSAGR